MEKFVSEDDELIGELEKMISINALEVMRETFPEELRKEKDDAMQKGIEVGREDGIKIGSEKTIFKMAKTMKDFGADFDFISKMTGLSIEEIEKI
ncbi:hypothetical protein [Methanobrevibacter sp.]|uniref:hypothetical protein n=1 Tax=Methanobrevibacter sp. TaxID=66852 RepID=UPI00388DEDB1